MTIHCIAFDLDDTLWACKPVIHAAEKELYTYLEHSYPKITHCYSFEQLIQQSKCFMIQHSELSYDLSLLRQRWLSSLANEFNYESEMVDTAFRVFWLARNKVQFYTGVLDILAHLSQQFRLGVISNGNADVNHIGIGKLFDFTVSAREAGVAKPHPDIFKLALKKAQCQAHEMIYVGDDLQRDIYGANQAGLTAIWYRPQLTNQEHRLIEYSIKNFNDLASCIATIAQAQQS